MDWIVAVTNNQARWLYLQNAHAPAVLCIATNYPLTLHVEPGRPHRPIKHITKVQPAWMCSFRCPSPSRPYSPRAHFMEVSVGTNPCRERRAGGSDSLGQTQLNQDPHVSHGLRQEEPPHTSQDAPQRVLSAV